MLEFHEWFDQVKALTAAGQKPSWFLALALSFPLL